MFEDIRSYFIRNVLANYNEFRDQIKSKEYGLSADIRTALNAAYSLYHIREHIPKGYQKSRLEITKECPEYDLLGDIVNASKHKEINKNAPKLKKASAIQEILITTEYADKEGKYFDTEKKVFAILDSGEEIDLQHILLTVINYWIEELKNFDISFNKFSSITKDIPVKRSSLSDNPKLEMQVIRGDKFDFRVRFRKYDYEKKEIIPIDISDHDFSFNIYNPEFTGHFSMTDKNTGERHEITFPITAEQQEKLESIEDEELKQLYMNKILQTSEVVREKLKKIKINQ